MFGIPTEIFSYSANRHSHVTSGLLVWSYIQFVHLCLLDRKENAFPFDLQFSMWGLRRPVRGIYQWPWILHLILLGKGTVP